MHNGLKWESWCSHNDHSLSQSSAVAFLYVLYMYEEEVISYVLDYSLFHLICVHPATHTTT